MHTKFNIEVSGFQNKEMKNFRVGFSRQMLNASATCSNKGFRYPKNEVGMYNLHLIWILCTRVTLLFLLILSTYCIFKNIWWMRGLQKIFRFYQTLSQNQIIFLHNNLTFQDDS